jgi:hypothetical protein
MQHVCQSQFHGVASACAEMLLHARIIGAVEKSGFSTRARACVLYPWTRFLGKEGFLYFGVLSMCWEALERRIFPQGSYGRIGLHLPIDLERGAVPEEGHSQLAACLPVPVSRSWLRLRDVAFACAEYTGGRKTGFCARARARAQPS